MLENKQKLSEAAFTYAIKAAAFQGEVDFARRLLTERNNVRFRPREELYVIVSAIYYGFQMSPEWSSRAWDVFHIRICYYTL